MTSTLTFKQELIAQLKSTSLLKRIGAVALILVTLLVLHLDAVTTHDPAGKSILAGFLVLMLCIFAINIAGELLAGLYLARRSRSPREERRG